MIQFMIDYLNEKDANFKLLPTNIGLEDNSINLSVNNYNSLVLERNKRLKSSRPQNPIIQNLDIQLIELQKILSASLQNLMQSVTLQLSSLENEIIRIVTE